MEDFTKCVRRGEKREEKSVVFEIYCHISVWSSGERKR